MHVRHFVIWTLKIIAAGILSQAAWLKFIADPECINIFVKINLEPWGRISSGITELIAAVLILIPRTTAWGALLAMIMMTGIIFFHITALGLVVYNDSGLFFYMSIIVWVCSAILFMIYRAQVLIRLQKIID